MNSSSFSDPEAREWPAPGCPDDGRTRAAGGALSVLLDMELPLMVRFGATRMLLRDLMKLTAGSVIDLDHASGDEVELLVNGTVIARGAPVTVQGNYGIRVSEIATAPEKIAASESLATPVGAGGGER